MQAKDDELKRSKVRSARAARLFFSRTTNQVINLWRCHTHKFIF